MADVHPDSQLLADRSILDGDPPDDRAVPLLAPFHGPAFASAPPRRLGTPALLYSSLLLLIHALECEGLHDLKPQFQSNHHTFTLILLIEIVLCSQFS